MITIIAKFNVLNGSVDEFKKCAVNVVRDTRKEKGNLAYKIYQSREDATRDGFTEPTHYTTMQSIFFNFLRTSNRLQRVTFKSNSL